jgi:enhancer of mRNA-decapping protein 4
VFILNFLFFSSNFKRDEKQHCYETNGANIIVLGNRGDHTHGSSKVKLKNIVDYKWEQKNYPGRLIAVHMEGIIAYSIKVSNREGMVRVVHIGQSQRALIKGMSGEVLDLQFAHIKSEVLLGCIEETALHIHKIALVHDKIVCTLVLKITDILKDHVPKYDRISWCPYVAETVDDIDEDSSKYLVWVRGNNFHCYSVNAIVGSVGVSRIFDNFFSSLKLFSLKTGEFASKDIEIGCLKFTDNIDCITCAIYSPDGTTLAISSEDGTIRFYQVYFLGNDINPRCLHQWKPHDGKVISSFFFLDNHTKECAE